MRVHGAAARCFAVLLSGALLVARVVAQDSKNGDEGNSTSNPILKVGGAVRAPRAIYMPDPEYSGEAREAGHQGTCILRLIVGADGKPSEVSIERGIGMGLDERAMDAVRSWVFEPARKDGKPVAVEIHVEVGFRLYKDAREMFSSEQLKQMSEERARVQSRVYRDPEGHSPRLGCPSSSLEAKPRLGPVITIADVSFDGSLMMTVADQHQISTSIRQQTYPGDRDEVTSQVLERAREAWQRHGYSDVRVQGNATVLSSSPANEEIAVAIQVEEGPPYRLERIAFKNIREVSNNAALRSLFHIKDGDIFDHTLIKEGFDKLRNTYLELGHLDFAYFPEPAVSEGGQSIALDIEVNEGKKFFVSRIGIMGLDEATFRNVRKDLLIKPGDVYDQRLVNLFLQNHASLLPAKVSPDSSIGLEQDEQAGTVAITYDFRGCSQ